MNCALLRSYELCGLPIDSGPGQAQPNRDSGFAFANGPVVGTVARARTSNVLGWRRCIRSFRRLVVVRMSAIWLIVLVLSPWTAPFATCDLATSWSHATDNGVMVSPGPDIAASIGDRSGCVAPGPARLRRPWLEHSLGAESLIGPITVRAASLDVSDRPTPPGFSALASAVLRV
jgi:hypothetical protein